MMSQSNTEIQPTVTTGNYDPEEGIYDEIPRHNLHNGIKRFDDYYDNNSSDDVRAHYKFEQSFQKRQHYFNIRNGDINTQKLDLLFKNTVQGNANGTNPVLVPLSLNNTKIYDNDEENKNTNRYDRTRLKDLEETKYSSCLDFEKPSVNEKGKIDPRKSSQSQKYEVEGAYIHTDVTVPDAPFSKDVSENFLLLYLPDTAGQKLYDDINFGKCKEKLASEFMNDTETSIGSIYSKMHTTSIAHGDGTTKNHKWAMKPTGYLLRCILTEIMSIFKRKQNHDWKFKRCYGFVGSISC